MAISDKPLCAACGQEAATSGDHALACASSGLYRRHNLVRDHVAVLCRLAGWHSQLEVGLPPEAGSNSRPADVFLSNVGVKPVALDIGVSPPLRPSAPGLLRDVVGESADRQELSKLRSMGSVCSSFGWVHKPICFETTGAWGPGAGAFLRKLARTVATRGVYDSLAAWSLVLATIQLALAKGCAEMLLRSAGPATPLHLL